RLEYRRRIACCRHDQPDSDHGDDDQRDTDEESDIAPECVSGTRMRRHENIVTESVESAPKLSTRACGGRSGHPTGATMEVWPIRPHLLLDSSRPRRWPSCSGSMWMRSCL